MRFAMATNDGYQCVLEKLLSSGWELVKLFVSPGDWMHDIKQVIERALALGVEVQYSPIDAKALADLRSRGCTVLVVASYRWKIPEWRADLSHAINFHPSPLPDGRGPYPLVRAILEGRTSWAVSCHKISEHFDCGEVLDSERFPMDSDENRESLSLKVQMAAARLAERIGQDFESRWNGAVPQEGGSYWGRWTEQERCLDFSLPVQSIIRTVRAFGDIESSAEVNGTRIFVHRAKGWREVHFKAPGTVVHTSDLSLVVAAADGFIAITQWSFHSPGTISGKFRQ